MCKKGLQRHDGQKGFILGHLSCLSLLTEAASPHAAEGDGRVLPRSKNGFYPFMICDGPPSLNAPRWVEGGGIRTVKIMIYFPTMVMAQGSSLRCGWILQPCICIDAGSLSGRVRNCNGSVVWCWVCLNKVSQDQIPRQPLNPLGRLWIKLAFPTLALTHRVVVKMN